MKTKLITIGLLFITQLLFAGSKELFELDEAKVEASVAEATQLETYITNNELTISELMTNENSIKVFNLSNFETKKPISPVFDDINDIDWGSFAWGFCCWPIGFFTVILNNNKDNDAKISYLIGIVAGAIIWGGFWWFGSRWWWYY